MPAKHLSTLVQSFFTVALPSRGVRPLTILSYRDAIKLLLRFAAERKKRAVVQLEIGDCDAAAVQEFLDYLEQKRGNDIVTRNNRLAAIRSFFRYAAEEEPLIADQCRRVCLVPMKRAPVRTVTYLEQDEMRAILAAPDRATKTGVRDHALLLFLYNSGARVQELTAVRAFDLRLARPRQVLLHGKGNKERICPLWPETGTALAELLERDGVDPRGERPVFRGMHGEALTRFGVAYILKKYAKVAADRTRTLVDKRLSPHTVRHTAAVHMLNSGVDLTVIRSWLGHADLRTTNIYAEINLETKRKAVEACASAAGAQAKKRKPSWRRNKDLLAWLEDL